jgi:general secretion pathway protein A
MYLEFYGLEQAPFSITPDPHYVFLSEHHRDALAHLLYGIRQGGGGGFVQLTGEVGTGKTTLSRLLLNQLPENTQAALVLNPRLDPVELLQTICEELRLPVAAGPAPAAPPPAPVAGKRDRAKAGKPTKVATPQRPGGKALFDALSAHLLQAYARGERVVLIIDEAQNLSPGALEQVRLLTNLETETQKLLQIILIGQPELRDLLAKPELRQLAQRITARYHLRPLDEAGTEAYLRHRLNTAGARRFPFAPAAVRRMHRRSGGVPRLINIIAERALLGGYAHDLLAIDAKTVDRAADEALAPGSGGGARRELAKLALLGGLAVAATVLALLAVRRPAGDAASPAPAALESAAPTATSAATTLDGDALRQRLQHVPATSTREWHRLLADTQAPAALRDAAPDACPVAPGWHCLHARIALDPLLRIDRPVLLRLRAEPHVAWARLLGADGDRVRLSLDGVPIDTTRLALASVWNGETLALWPAPDALERRHAAGDAEARAWVRKRLRAAGLAMPDDAAALRTFQIRHGLTGDGRLDGFTAFALSAQEP